MARKKSEPKEYLFVDGYNIINTWNTFKGFQEEKLEVARKKLMDILIEYQSYTGMDITLVFDAHLVKGNSGTRENYNGLKVIYTQEYETADHYIERTISQMSRLKRIRVATSDKLEQEIILSRGATRVSARELEIEILGNKKFIEKKQANDNEKNNYHFGKLSDEILEKLKNINTKQEDA